MTTISYAARERARQLGARAEPGRYPKSGTTAGTLGSRAHDVLLPHWDENLYEPIRASAIAYFGKRIAWHRMRGHVLSSQICCLNVLMPFATRPAALAALLAPAFPGKTIAPVAIAGEAFADGAPCYVAFEWTGHGNYLGEVPEGARLTRGANSTSLDAMVLLDVDGRREMLLIEWKYTESYGPGLRDTMRVLPDGTEMSSNKVRQERYAEKLFAPHGPLKADAEFTLADLFYEPFYQFARQQMLAFQLEKPAHRDKEGGAERVLVLHLAPRENIAFKRITARKLVDRGETACGVWQSLLESPDRFDSRHIDDLLATFDAQVAGMADWAAYIEARYGWPAKIRP